MREEILHQFWHAKWFNQRVLKTTLNLSLKIWSFGKINVLQGPDFKGVHLEIDGHEIWGDIEIHSKASDWFLHGHHLDQAYDQVMLHVVWENDKNAVTRNGRNLPTLVLSDFFTEKDLHKIQNKPWAKFPCISWVKSIPQSIQNSQFSIAQNIELSKNTEEIYSQAHLLGFHWEKVFFVRLLSYSVDPQNRTNMSTLANVFPLHIIKRNNLSSYLPWLLKQTGIWDATPDKIKLKFAGQINWESTRLFPDLGIHLNWYHRNLRPTSYPIIRLLQAFRLLDAYHGYFEVFFVENNFKSMCEMLERKSIPALNNIPVWNLHQKAKLIQNIFIPFWNARRLYLGSKQEKPLLDILKEGPFEGNRITDEMTEIFNLSRNGQVISFSLMSQFRNFCSEKRCTECLVGRHLWIS